MVESLRLVKRAKDKQWLNSVGLNSVVGRIGYRWLQAKLNQISLQKHFCNYHGAQFQRERNTNIQRPVMKTSANIN
jgi:hypothetical protein